MLNTNDNIIGIKESRIVMDGYAYKRNTQQPQQQKPNKITYRRGIRRRLNYLPLLAIILCFLFAGCKHKDLPEPETQPSEMTVIVYMAAENNLAQYCIYDLNEMEKAASRIPSTCNFVVYVDTNMSPVIYRISAKNGKVEHRRLDERNSCAPATFEQNLREIVNDFPAEHYGLVMWSHASGWMPTMERKNVSAGAKRRTFGIDNNNNTTSNNGSELEIADMRKVFENVGIKWDYILFDACYMQCIETAYELRSTTDYIIASPAEIPGFGAPYDKLMDCLTEKDQNYMYNIAQIYFDDYKTNIGLEISTIKTDELDSLLRVTRKLLPDYYSMAYTLPTNDIQSYYFYSVDIGRPEYHDMGSTIHKMLTPDAYTEWRRQADKTIISQLATRNWFSSSLRFYPVIIDPEHITLASIFIPNGKYDTIRDMNQAITQTQWYKDYNK